MNKSDAKLKEFLESLLEEEVKNIPTDSQIKTTHIFSKAFEKDMRRLIQKNKIQKMHRMYKILGVCAVFAILIAIGGVNGFFLSDESAKNVMEGITEECAEEESAAGMESMEQTDVEDDVSQENFIEEGVVAYDYTEEEKQSWIKSSYSDEINVEDMETEPIGMQVSTLEQGEEGIVLCQQIQNNTEKEIRYMEGSYMLEIWNNDGWYVISTSEEAKLSTLAPNSRYANDIVISGVTLYEGYQYRLLSMFDGEMKASMFILE